MSLNSKVAIQVEIKNIKQVADLKSELKKLRAEQKEHEKYAKTGKFTSKAQEKGYIDNAKAISAKSKALRGLNQSISQNTKTTQQANKATGSMTSSFVKAQAIYGAVMQGFRMLSQTVGGLISTFAKFEYTMATVYAVSGATDEEFKKLNETARALGKSTAFTTTQVAQLMVEYSKLGFSVAEIQNVVKPTIDLAIATGSDLARAATVAGSAVRGFGLDAGEASRVTDVMAVSFNSSAMDIEKWQTSMTKVAPISKAAGFSIEDTAAIMSKLTDAGIEASIAGTSLRNILLKMQDPSSELTKAFGGTIHGLDQLIPAMEKFVAQGGSMADIMEVVDVRQAATFEHMLSSSDSILELRDRMEEASGEAAQMALIMGNTVKGATDRFKSAAQEAGISLMENFGGAIKQSLNEMTVWLNGMVKGSNGFKDLIEKIKFVTKAIAYYVIGLKALALYQTIATKAAALFATTTTATGTALTFASKSTVLFAASMRTLKAALISTGIGALVVGLGEVIAHFATLQTEEEKVAGAMDEYGRVISTLIDKKAVLLGVEEQGMLAAEKEIESAEKLIKKYKDLEGSEKTAIEIEKERIRILTKLAKKHQDIIDPTQTLIRNTDIQSIALGNQKTAQDKLNTSLETYKTLILDIAMGEAAADRLAGLKVDQKLTEAELVSKKQQTDKLANDYNLALMAEQKIKEVLSNATLVPELLVDVYQNIQGKTSDAIAEQLEASRVQLQALSNEQPEFTEAIDVLEKLIELGSKAKIESEKNGTPKGNAPENTIDTFTPLEKELQESIQRVNKLMSDGLISIVDGEIEKSKLIAQSYKDQSEALSNDEEFAKKKSELLTKATEQEIKTKELVAKKGLNIHKLSYEVEVRALAERLALKEDFSKDGLTSEEGFNLLMLEAKKKFLENERSLLDGDRINKTAELEANKTQVAQNQDDINKLVLKGQLERLEIQKKAAETEFNKMLALGLITQAEHNQKLLFLEGEYLTQKGALLSNDAVKTMAIANEIDENNIKIHQSQMERLEESVSAMSGVGGALQSLAGDNKSLNDIKNAGIEISKAASIIDTVLKLKQDLITLGIIKQTEAKGAQNIVDAQGNIISGTDIALKTTEGALTTANTAATIADTTATGANTTVTGINTVVTGASLNVDATKSILSSGKNLPFPINLIAFAATIFLISKIMKMFMEKGGIVEQGKKFANGGMVMGKSHAQGGEMFSAGGRLVELEGGEAVINKRSTAMFRNQLSDMNIAGGGVKFADGGMLNNPAFAQQKFTMGAGKSNGSQKVYVVEADISKSQNQVKVLQASSTI
jgi:TP901 family phage tail tape measure protein